MAGIVLAASLSSHFGTLAVAVAGMVFLSIITANSRGRWVGWTAGLIGAVAAEVIFTDGLLLPLAATVVGFGAAQFLLARDANRRLARETETLRAEQAVLRQRTVLARELHDVVGHQVTAMVIQAEAGRVGDPSGSLERIAGLGRVALGELDRMVLHLRDPAAALAAIPTAPRLEDIDRVLAETLRRAAVIVTVDIDDDLGLDDAMVLTVYRTVQEALTNIARHAQATSASVSLARERGRLRLIVTDDGVGPPQVTTRGMGLLGIRERVAAYSGTAVLSAEPAGGARLDVTMEL